MPRLPLHAVPVALQTLRTNPLHTALSTLGIVIGVAALVAILSLSDGMEQYARAQITAQTDLQTVAVRPHTTTLVDGVRVPLDTPARLTLDDLRALQTALAGQADATLAQSQALVAGLVGAAPADSARYGAVVQALLPHLLVMREAETLVGRLLDEADLVPDGPPAALVNEAFAARLTEAVPGAAADGYGALLGRRLTLGADTVQVAGVLAAPDDDEEEPGIAVPFDTTPAAFAEARPPMLFVQARRIEDVPAVRDIVAAWLDTEVTQGAAGFAIVTNASLVEQVKQGMLAFKLIMGFITGIAVVVGGVGVMNVLLVSITERTREIGVRKATGARRSDVLAQFLAEAVTISLAGCLAGLALGLATVWTATAAVDQVLDVPFTAALTPATVVVVLVVALGIGLVFGTYPAWRAARLAPIDALRHE